MREYRIQWCKYPLNHNESKLLFIEANSPEDAKECAGDYIERKYRIPAHDFVIERISETKPVPSGTVKEG